ncbi:molybdate ABC transporter substrate-binding protein [Mycobacterium sp.]|uniref:molybdate ABC transporter substrate-binding protein n=1 Tax=Mycobacterium sp. TaxID=1785 RepID=UPI002CCE92DD|nr:molybdate ABC transporter substrate-binding protein [Mycobacterium sp.]HME49222.1 molybdate ABC transporter substrate-binding protein [Mycobacterium sp.]
MSSRSKRALAAGAVLAVALAGCGSQSRPTTSITVFASSSLIKSFSEIGRQFKSDNPGTSVEFIFAGSSDLAAQLTDGASADVFAAGDLPNMARVTHAGLVAGNPVNFASNKLAIAVAPGNPRKITSFVDLNRPGLRVAVCARPLVCASEVQRIEDNTGIQLHPTAQDSTTADIVRNVTDGQVDAGLVYTTDALNAGDNIAWFNIPESVGAANTYSIALMKDSDQARLAGQFIRLVTGDTGRKILSGAGFAAP